jgi:1,2-diacylglycerol 3-alpha-glucosyltransferase
LIIVKEADCGIMVNFQEKEAAIQQISKYLSEAHPEHEKNARKYAIENLEWNTISERYLDMFKNIVKN